MNYKSFSEVNNNNENPEMLPPAIKKTKKKDKKKATIAESPVDEDARQPHEQDGLLSEGSFQASAAVDGNSQKTKSPFYKERVGHPDRKFIDRITGGSTKSNKSNKINNTFKSRYGGEDSDQDDHFEQIFNRADHFKRRASYHGHFNEFTTPCVCLYIGIFFFAIALCYGLIALTQSFACLGPPYLYITHKGSKNIMKFSRDGCLIHEKILWGVTNENSDLRGMSNGKFYDKDVLYVADSSSVSGLIMFGECFDQTSLRPFISRIVTSMMNPGASHGYGIAVDREGDIYASFQQSDAVLRFTKNTFQPMPNHPDLTPIFYFKNGTKHDKDKASNSSAAIIDVKSNSTHTKLEDYYSNREQNKTKSEKNDPKGKNEAKSKDNDDDNDDDKDKKKKSKSTKGKGRRYLSNENHDFADSYPQLQHHPLPHNLRRQLKNTIEQPTFEELENFTEHFSQEKVRELHPDDFYNGTFVQFGLPDKHSSTERGIRAIQWVKNYTELWITNEDLDGVVVVNREGKLLGSIFIKKPVGLYHSPEDHPDVVFIGSKFKKQGGVFAFDIHNRRKVKSYQSIGMTHPTGMVAYRDVLFVNDQSRNAVLTFNITTGRVINLIIPSSKFHGDIEHIMISHC
jgi:hypothetical protein